MKAFEIYIEGGFHKTVNSIKTAERLREKYASEGWNVKVLKVIPTIVGDMKVEVA